ncbi:hypothetical protein ACHAPT_007317 [Fusarium lateritium]
MPRRRASSSSSAPVQKRTRSGCQTCRSRKVKCDEARPRCHNCESRGLACSRHLQLKWEPEFAARGLSFGREGVWCKGSVAKPRRQSQDRTPILLLASPSVGPRHFINTYCSDFDPDSNHEQGLGDETVELREQADLSSTTLVFRPQLHPSLIPSPSLYPTLNTSEQSLFQYYLLRLCPLTTPSPHLSSPFVSLVAPLFALSGQDLVVQSVLAFSARHRSITDPQWARAAMKMKGNVLTGLLRKMQSPYVGAHVILDPQVPAAMMFLCLYEILDNCDHRWVIHLRASQDFMRKRRQLLTPFSQDSGFGSLAAFVERYFAFQDVISRTACGNSPLFGLEYWQKPDQSEDIDAWMGCSPAMASVIFRITELARSRDRDAMSRRRFESEVAELDRELTLVGSNMTIIEALDDTVRRCVELKKSSVEVYFHCLLRDAHPSTWRVSQLVAEILASVQELVKQGCVAGLLFPLFVAAVELNPLDDGIVSDGDDADSQTSSRRQVLEALDAMAGASLANIERTKAVILKVWRMRDLQTEYEHVATGGQNDWHTFVSPYTQNLSLA